MGGRARFRIIAVLAAVLGLDLADSGVVAAVSDQLKHVFAIGNEQVGLLLAVVAFAGAAGTIPMGVLADRAQRRVVLVAAVLAWGVAMVLSGTASSYTYLLAARLFLGTVAAAAWPCAASLVGDFFPARDRAGIYGLILSGELIGVGIGFFVAGEVSSFADWHWAFYVMALPSVALGYVIWRYLPEPARGTQRWIRAGETDAYAASAPDEGGPRPERERSHGRRDLSALQRIVEKAEVEPRENLVLRADPTGCGWWSAMGYLLRVPSYRLLIAASTLAYFFFSGIRAFAMIYFTKHYGLSRGMVSALVLILGAGTLAGLVTGGRLAEKLLRRGQINARIIIPAFALFGAVPLLALGIWTRNPWLAIVVLTAGMGALAAAVAPIDAARLDIVHPRLWGRGESGRMAVRSTLEGGAPLLAGALSGLLGGDDKGLMWTLLIMLIPMLSAGALILPGLRAYPRDVATAAASATATYGGDR